MRKSKIFYRFFILFFFTGLVFLHVSDVCYALEKDRKKGKNTYVMTTIELQSELMSYADRFGMIMFNAFDKFNAMSPSPEARHFVHGDMVYSTTSVFTIAALPNPEAALLDMVVVATLGRFIYEYKILKKFGEPIIEIINGFKKIEADIWRIAEKVLSQEQQRELRTIIVNWMKNNPNQLQFFLIRFSELGADRTKSTLVKKGKTGGLFGSVKEVTQQVEETRMLAERGMYLATRLPLMTGSFTEFWMSQLLTNPEVEKILADLHGFSEVSQRLAVVAEQMPQQIAKERRNLIKQASDEMANLRQATIDQVMKEVNTLSQTTINRVMTKVALERETAIKQFMDRLAGERQNAFQELIAEEQRIKGLVTELRETLAEGSNLLVSATAFTEKLNLGKPADKPTDAKPFDIQEYRNTIAEVSGTARELTTLVDKMDGLLTSDGWGQLLPQIVNTLAKVESEGEKVINHTFRQAILLILIWLVGYVIARLILQRLAKK
jgi:hypothetical protein